MHTTDHGHPTFEDVLTEMAGTRSTFESLRSAGGSFDERARLITRLHDLRARAADLRSTL